LLDRRFVAEAIEEERAALGGEGTRDAEANAAGRAGDDRRFAFERHLFLLLEQAFGAAALLALGGDFVLDAQNLVFELADIFLELGNRERREIAQLRLF